MSYIVHVFVQFQRANAQKQPILNCTDRYYSINVRFSTRKIYRYKEVGLRKTIINSQHNMFCFYQRCLVAYECQCILFNNTTHTHLHTNINKHLVKKVSHGSLFGRSWGNVRNRSNTLSAFLGSETVFAHLAKPQERGCSRSEFGVRCRFDTYPLYTSSTFNITSRQNNEMFSCCLLAGFGVKVWITQHLELTEKAAHLRSRNSITLDTYLSMVW